MRVLHVVHTPRHSGAEILVASLTAAHARLRMDSCVVSLNPPEESFKPLIEEQAKAGVKWITPTQPLKRIARVKLLYRVWREVQPSVVFAHSVLPAIYARVAIPGSVVPVLHAEHNFQDFITRCAEALLQFRTKTVVAVSDVAAKRYAGRYSKPRVVFIPNGIDSDAFRSKSKGPCELRKELKIPQSSKIVIQVGRVNEVKRQHLSLDALRQLNHEDTHLVFVGPTDDVPYERRLKAVCASEDLYGRVHFLGARSDVPSLLAASDVFLMPSRQEAQGIALLEALAVGLPAVVSEISGFEYAREFEGVHFVSEVTNAESLTRAINRALSGPSRYLRDMSRFDLRTASLQYVEVARACTA